MRPTVLLSLTRLYLILVSVVCFVLGAVLEMIGTASLSAIGNTNPVSAAIPDSPDSWVMCAMGIYLVGLAAIHCGFACTPHCTSMLCSHFLLLNSGLAFVGSVVLLGLELSGVHMVQPSTWDALRKDGVLNGTHGDDGLSGFAATVLQPDVLRLVSIVLVPVMLLALIAEVYLLCCLADREQGEDVSGTLVTLQLNPRFAFSKSRLRKPTHLVKPSREKPHAAGTLIAPCEESGGSRINADI